jgi:hypothetical protein
MSDNKQYTFYKNFSKNALIDKVHKKNNLNYIPWSDAWEEAIKLYPDLTFNIEEVEIKKKIYERDQNGNIISETEQVEKVPYTTDKDMGYLVKTSITIEGKTFKMWLPVMDFKNKAIKSKDINMCDINKTIMRCLVKNLALFGLGLHVYKGEDLPEGIKIEEEEKRNENIGEKRYEEITNLYNEVKPKDEEELSKFNLQFNNYLKNKIGKTFEDLEIFNVKDYEFIKKALELKKQNLQINKTG